MSDKFRQEVEAVVGDAIQEVTGFKNITAGDKGLAPLLVKAILAAHNAEIERIAQGMDLIDRTKYFFPFLAQEVALNQRASDQDHILAERAGK